jgi:predicted PurR-regulated permease PerM
MANGNAKIYNKEGFSNIFLLVILLGILYLCYLLFRPFLYEITIAGILVTIFYPIYLKIVYWTRGRMFFSSLILCLFILLILIIPFTFFLYYLANEALALYSSLTNSGTGNVVTEFFSSAVWNDLNIQAKELIDVQKFLMDTLTLARGVVISGATAIISGVTNFIISILLVFFSMFFLFIEGKNLMKRVMQLTPLSNKYDKLIWMKFRDVSYTTVVASFVVAFCQSIVGMVGFLVVGLSPLLAGVLLFLFSFLPYVGTVVIWLPAAIYLLVIGQTWQGIFMLIWGAFGISLVDNLVRPMLIQGKARVHPMIMFFSIIGGISLMGFWGVVFGPLIVALAFTILHIYELQYSNALEK